MVDLELISFELCPFVQRSVITLLYKEAPYKITYIDLADPPPWFLEISPFGKVPVLRVDHHTVIFESAVINEYIDEITQGRLQPEDPLQRALNRSWIEFGSACLVDSYKMVNAKTDRRFEDTRDELQEKLERVEEVLGSGPYFNGAQFSLADCAYAPLFMRLEFIRDVYALYDKSDLPKLNRWSETLLSVPAVRGSVVPDLKGRYFAMIRERGGHLASLLPPR